ncbi:SCO7613 C-terminal domain-containing membrane protein [Micromonospora cathayae]|uniref:Permease n=1 Tax=Micromonospora cathayae TaxID=3028804 RepID=A0ABY7ZPZ8_9ACTN|nr:hypothetical protein [Micromonospora sp. HUAS 3]WDZ85084.1 hypothetical protein PVK37_01005 [Micromonospora sp. HUAS 3]
MQITGYPCPGCAAPADLTVGCRSCGRGPDPVAAEVVRLDAEIPVLSARVEQARRTYLELGATLHTAQRRRAELAARVRASRTVPPRPVPPRAPVPAGPGMVAPTPAGPLPVGPTSAGPVPVGSLPVGPVVGVPPVGGRLPVGPPVGVPVVAGGRETSTRTVQGLLFVLGGLLLGTAAIVFTAVAWASVGIVGRAAILAGFTALALAVPPVVARRGLRGTAETFAAVGLLLVLLDGYAAWTVDLFGVAGWPGTRYVALAGGVSAAVAAGYGLLTRLAVPWFTALIVVQPVLPLLAVEARPDAAGWAMVLAGVALLDLAVLGVLRAVSAPAGQAGPASVPFGVAGPATVPAPVGPAGPASAAAPVGQAGAAGPRVRPVTGPLGTAGRVVAWIGYALAMVPATVCALVALALGEVAGTAYLAGAPLLAVGAVLLGAALVAGGPVFRGIAAGLLVVLAAAAVLRPVAELRPSMLLVTAALVALASAGSVRLLPGRTRTGPRVGALVVAGGTAQVALLLTGVLAVAAVARSAPPWRGAAAGPDLSWGWQLPVAVLLTALAAALLSPRAARFPIGLASGVVTVLATPAVHPAPWPAVLTLDLVAGVVLLLAAVFRPGRRGWQPVLTATGGVLLTGHALLVGMAAPVGAGAVLAGLLLTGLVMAGRGRRLTGPGRELAGPALTVAVLVVPALVVVTLIGLDTPVRWRLRGLALAVGLLPVALVAVRRHWPDLRGYAVGALAVAPPLAGLVPLVVPAGESVPLYLASMVLVAAVGSVVGATGVLRMVGAGLAAVTVAALAPTWFLVLVAPYGWLGDVWSGAPDGVGLPSGLAPVRLSAGVALLLLLAAVAVAARSGPDRPLVPLTGGPGPDRPAFAPAGRSGSGPSAAPLVGRSGVGRSGPGRFGLGGSAVLVAGLPLVALAGPVLAAGAGAPWPVMPGLSLLVGVAVLLAAALVPAPAPGGSRAGWLVRPVLAWTGVPLVGAGLAGLVPTRATTLAGLGLMLVAAVVVGVAGRSAAVRPAGWIVATLTATGFALTAASAGDLPLRTTAFAVLAVAVLALVTAARLAGRRPGESLVLDASAQAVALTALLLTVGSLRHAAVVCTLWGAVVALRSLRPGESIGRRWGFATIAGASELFGGWLLLAAGQVALLEAYTLPAAALAVLAGVVAMRTRTGLTSWPALGPGLAAALLPSLVSVLFAPDPQPWRRLLLGAGALLVVLAGAVRRWQAPVLSGAATLALLALHEAIRSWDLVPRWIFLAVGGFALIGLATTYERRRRDLARLRSLVGRLG